MIKKSYFWNKINMMKGALIEKLIRQLVPEDILTSFDITDIDDKKPEELIIRLVEKESKKPNDQDGLIMNGYLKEIELTHFPSNGRECYLRLKRRRWKIKDEEPPKTYYYNDYDFSVSGTKVTKSFGSFLKEFDR
jgi:hypothetical protein